MPNPIEVIAFDADDTLWHNENIYRDTQSRVIEILAQYHDAEWIERRMYETEVKNLEHYGYGFKGFTLSMIETAIELTEGRISGTEIGQMIEITREMVRAPVVLLDSVEEAITELSTNHDLMLITKGELFEQEAKIIRSGLAERFSKIEIVRTKTPAIYRGLITKHKLNPQGFLMVGNSMRSDILPVLEIGGRAVHIPYETTWEHELVPEEELADKDFLQLTSIRELPALIEKLK
ncbi:MAG: HAD hydrolase-like protein [Acidobacteria bacterium]|nr:HAD hydrolase-like protein [Acidobacteriota bacterium]